MCPNGGQTWNVKDFHEYAHQEKGGAKPKMLTIFQREFRFMFIPSRTIVEGLEFTGLEQINFHIFAGGKYFILALHPILTSNLSMPIISNKGLSYLSYGTPNFFA
jgi:hypothetical protein